MGSYWDHNLGKKHFLCYAFFTLASAILHPCPENESMLLLFKHAITEQLNNWFKNLMWSWYWQINNKSQFSPQILFIKWYQWIFFKDFLGGFESCYSIKMVYFLFKQCFKSRSYEFNHIYSLLQIQWLNLICSDCIYSWNI